MRTRLIAGAAFFMACTPGSEQASSFGDPGAAAPSSSSGTTTRGDTTTGGPDPGEHSTGGASTGQDSPPIDMGTPPDFAPAWPPGCQGKIDFLFVISDGPFMGPHQDRLAASVPAFMQTIADEFAGFDTHILVTNAREGWGDPECVSCLQCPACSCESGGPGYPCGMGPELTECDSQRGAGMVFPAGPDASNHACDLGGDHRYITEETSDPAAAFACVTKLGAGGYSGRAIDAMFAALGDDMNSPQGCNAGFLRDDALLVVTLIVSWSSEGGDYTPFVLAWMLRDKKGGDDDAIVLLAIQNDSPDPDGICKPYTDEVDLQFYEFVDEMAHGVKGSVCADDYADYFKEAARLARQQCGLVPR